MDRIRIDIIPTSSSIDFQGLSGKQQGRFAAFQDTTLLVPLLLSHQILISMSAYVCMVWYRSVDNFFQSSTENKMEEQTLLTV